MSKNGFKVVDCDRHIMEPDDLWDKYLEAPFRHYNLAGGLRTAKAGVRMGVVDVQNRRPLPLQAGETAGGLTSNRHTGWRSKFKHAISRRFDNVSYLDDMDVEGVDIAFMFPSAGLYFCSDDDLDPELSAAMCRAYNNWLSEYRSLNPERMKGVCLLPFQNVELALSELRRAVEKLGMEGVFWRPNPIMGRLISDQAYDPIFALCSELGVPIGLHEGVETILPQFGRGRVDTHFARHAMSHPTEQMGAALALISNGVLDRFPGLRVAFLESGSGWLPYWLERLDMLHANELFRDGHLAQRKPSDYLRRGQCYISCEAGEETISLLGRTLGQDCLMWASDYPHPDAILYFPDTLKGLFENDRVSDDFKRKILWDNPVRFYNLKV